MQDSNEPHHNESELNEQIAIRKQKLELLQSTKNTAFPNDFKPSHLAADISHQYHASGTDDLAKDEIAVKIAGRMMTRRLMGKASFFNLQDSSGQIQVYVNLKDLNEEIYEAFKSWDLGDIVGLSGILFRTKTNELSVRTESIGLLTKSLRPLPNKWQGLQDLEICYRQRYLDLIVNQKSKHTFLLRSKAIQAMRMFFLSKDYLEVETPMMHPIPGGAAAKPFVTHHNALDMTLYLRIAPELYLKRLVVGGMERVFEINRNFRNEGLSTRHNPEFTMIEFYQAYSTYHDLMDLTEELFKHLLTTLNLPHKLPYQGAFLDFGKKFSRLTMRDAVKLHNPKLSEKDMNSLTKLGGYLKELGQHVDSHWGLGRLQMEIFEATVETKLQDPTFITEYPIEVSPLARRNDDNHEVSDRAELFIAGRELANIFSELNDPIDQAKRFQAQASEKEAGDEEAMAYDADFVRALEYGLPPTAGEGIGIDRLIMLLSDSPAIRDVLLFPQMRATTIA